MNRFLLSILLSLGALAAAGLLATSAARADDSAGVKALFADPPRQYAPAPLWVWNDMLTEEQIRGTLGDLAGQKVKQVFVHPRPGLMTPYLEQRLVPPVEGRPGRGRAARHEHLDLRRELLSLGLRRRLVPEAMPESRGKGLHFAEVKQPGKLGDDVVAVYRLTDDGFENVTAEGPRGQDAARGTLPGRLAVRCADRPAGTAASATSIC